MDVNLNKLHALVSLLDDENQEIVQQIEGELLAMGQAVLPILEDSFLQVENAEHKDRLEAVIEKIKIAKIKNNLADWLKGEQDDLLKAWCFISELSGVYPDYQKIRNTLDKVKLEVWLGMHNDQSSVEKISLLNYIFFTKMGFNGDHENYLSPANSYVHEVVNRKKGNPISLSVLYMLIAQSLKLPVYGINLPQHFVLAYLPLAIEQIDELGVEELKQGKDIVMPVDFNNDPIFYINVYNKGSIFSKNHLTGFLRELKLQPKSEYYKVCSSKEIILRILRNLQTAFAKVNNVNGIHQVDELLALFVEHV